MARATAHLEVTVNDKQLVDHASTLKQTRDTWDSLVKAAKDFSGAYTQDMGKGFADLGKGLAVFNKIDATKVKEVFQALKETAKTDMSKFIKHLEGFDQKFIPLVKNTKAWGDQLARVFGYIKALEDRLDTLGIQQQKTVQLSNKFEGELKQITDAMKLQADTMKGLVQSYAGFNRSLEANEKLITGGSGALKAKAKAAKDAEKNILSLERAFIRHATAMFIADQWLKSIIDGFRTAAQEMDLTRVMARNAEGFQQIFEDTQKATKGMVSNLQILKSSALMSSFGIPIQNLAQNMELIQKMAIRTGQPMEYMMDSFARGVSRLSPAILDNLGLQIKLGDAYTAYSAKVGVSTDKMDAFAKKQAVLNEVLRQMGDLTKDIDPYASIQARLDKATVTFENWFSGLKGAILKGILAIDMDTKEALAQTADTLAIYVKEEQEFGMVRSDIAKYSTIAIDAVYQKEVESRADFSDSILRILTLNLGDEEWYARRRRDSVKEHIIDLESLTKAQRKQLADEQKTISERMQRNEALMTQLEQTIKLIDLYKRDVEGYVAGDGAPAGLGVNEGIIADLEKRREGLDQSVKIFEDLFSSIQALGNYKIPQDSILASITKEVRTSYMEEQSRILELWRKAAAEGDAFAIAQQALEWSKIGDAQKSINATIQSRYKLYLDQEGLALAQLSLSKQILVQSQMLVDEDKTRLTLAFELESAQQELNNAQKLYGEMFEKANVLKGENAQYSAEDILAQAEAVKQIATRVAKMQEQAALDERINGLLKDQSFWTEQMKKDEAARLSGGKTKEEIQMRMIVLQKELNADLREERNIQLDLTSSIKQRAEAMFSVFGFSFMTGTSDAAERKKRIQSLKEEMDALKKAFDLLGTKGSGGGGRKPKEEIEKGVFSLTEEKAKSFSAYVSNTLKVLEMQTTTVRGSITGLTSGLQKDYAQFVEMVGSTTFGAIQQFAPGQGFGTWNGLLGYLFAGDSKSMLTKNEELAKTLEDFMKKNWDNFGPKTKDVLMKYADSIEDANERLREHVQLWTDVAAGIRDFGAASDWAMKYAKGLISDQALGSISELTTNLGALADTFEKALTGQADSYDLMGAGLNIVRGFTNEYIKDLKKRAAVEMLMNGAMAFASWGNTPKMVAHATAATMFGLVAGGAIRLPGQASGQDQKQSTQAGPLHIHLYSEMAMTDAERGYLIDRAVQQAAAEGRV